MVDHKIELNDTVGIRDKIHMEQNKPTKEEIANVEKSIVLLLLDLKRTLDGASQIAKRIGLFHVKTALKGCMDHIDVDLQEYQKQKEKSENAK